MSSDFDANILLSVVEHVFLPPKLPQQAPTKEAECDTNVALCDILIQAAQAFNQSLSPSQKLLWAHTTKMMSSICCSAKRPLVEPEIELRHTLSHLAVGGEFKLALACCLVVHLYFQMSSLCMFEPRTPL